MAVIYLNATVAAFLNGMFWVTDFPVRRTWMGEIAGNERVATAMSLDTVTGNGTRMLGPLLGGLLLQDDDYGWITAEIRALAESHCGGKIVSMLEGGYDLEALATASNAHVRALTR